MTTHINFNLKNQKDVINETSKRVIAYTKKGSPAKDVLKPYYLYRLNLKNELKEYLIGYKLVIVNHTKKSIREEFDMVKDNNLITRSKEQIEDDLNKEEIKYERTQVYLLAEKINGKWKPYLQPGVSMSTVNLTISAIEGNVHLDSVWLQDENKSYAIWLLLMNKIKSIAIQQRTIDFLKEREDILNTLYNKALKEKEKKNGSN